MNKRSPWWLLPNILSLDAPLVAVAWMWILANSLRVVYVETRTYWLVAAAVWCIYVIDRILDMWKVKRAEKAGTAVANLHIAARHEFHWKYRMILIPLVLAVASYGVYIAFAEASVVILTAGFSGIFLVIAYLLVRQLDLGEITYFKNLVAGLTFAYGVAAPIVLPNVELQDTFGDLYYHFTAESTVPFSEAVVNGVFNIFKMTIGAFGAVFFMTVLPLLFGLLCFMNITAIDLWQKSRSSEDEEEKDACEVIVGAGLIMLVAFTVFLAAFRLSEIERTTAYLVMVSAALLQMVNKKRRFFYLDAQRVLADFVMILPLPLVWFLVN